MHLSLALRFRLEPAHHGPSPIPNVLDEPEPDLGDRFREGHTEQQSTALSEPARASETHQQPECATEEYQRRYPKHVPKHLQQALR